MATPVKASSETGGSQLLYARAERALEDLEAYIDARGTAEVAEAPPSQPWKPIIALLVFASICLTLAIFSRR